MSTQAIEALFEESRRFPPPADFTAQANAQPGIYEEAEKDYQAFWAGWARKLEWMKPFTKTLEWNEPFAKWFADGELNVSVNCLDRHVRAGTRRQDRLLLRRRARRSLDHHLQRTARRVCRFANGMRELGIKKGDRVAIYMPMIPELPVAMLACARIGAAHSVIFGGFSPDSIVDRVNDSRVRRADHRRLGLAARQEGAAQAQLRHRDGEDAVGEHCHRRQTRRRRGLHARRPRPLVGRSRAGPAVDVRARTR